MLISNQDIFPTVINMLGYNIDFKIDGINVFNKTNEYVYSYKPYNGSIQRYMITDGFYKLITQFSEISGNIEFYDLINDPLEKNNLAKKINISRTRIFNKLQEFANN